MSLKSIEIIGVIEQGVEKVNQLSAKLQISIAYILTKISAK
jgi:hypothetical protein